MRVSLWRNGLKIEADRMEMFLDKVCKEWGKNDLGEMIYVVDVDEMKSLTETDEYKQGWFYIQNLSSIMPVMALGVQEGEKILDIAAAPGGKTALMANLMKNTGEIIANDISRERVFKLRNTLKVLGVTNTKVINRYGETLWRNYANSFDRVLADVPCSMDDRVEVTEKRIKSLVPRQKNLIWSAFTCLKLGGTMVYSTCTSTKEENEEVVAYLQEKEPKLCQVLEMKRIEKDELMGTFFYAKILKDM